jgi:hypothetical protein
VIGIWPALVDAFMAGLLAEAADLETVPLLGIIVGRMLPASTLLAFRVGVEKRQR